jgi:hypothetical protein
MFNAASGSFFWRGFLLLVAWRCGCTARKHEDVLRLRWLLRVPVLQARYLLQVCWPLLQKP